MADKRDYYEVLGVPKDADEDVYKRQAISHMPPRKQTDPLVAYLLAAVYQRIQKTAFSSVFTPPLDVYKRQR